MNLMIIQLKWPGTIQVLHNAMGDVNFPEEKNIMKVYRFYIICVMRGGGVGGCQISRKKH